MGRPRNSSNPMNPSRLLKQGSTNNMAIMNLNLPALSASQISRSLEEDLESQARSSIALFGFGANESNSVSWSKVNVNASTFDLGMGGGSSINSISGQSLMLMERVCPLGMNPILWNTMHNGEVINNGNGGGGGGASLDPADFPDHGPAYDEDGNEIDIQSTGYLYGSKILQQYLVKAVTLLPATVDEVVELLVRSDGDDMETAMNHLAGVKTTASGIIYRRRKKRLRRRHLPSGSSSGSRSGMGIASGAKSLSATTLSYESDSSSSSSGEEDDGDTDDAANGASAYNRVSLHTAPPPRRPSRKPRFGRESSVGRLERPTSLGSAEEFVAETANRGNLSIKWVVGDRQSRMFGAKVNYCLLDYECIMINDWDESDEGERSPMYIRALQSCYIPQCQPWMDEFNASRPTDLQPTGFMVREAKYRDGFVEVQFVGAVLEKAQLPNASRRAKLRSLVARISKLEEIITGRRLSQSLLAHQPMWVRNRERSSCHCCDVKFSLSRRRHHCRICGEVCCSECSPKMDVALPDIGVTSVRVCVSCLRKRRQSTDFTSSGTSFSIASSSYPSPRRGPSIFTPPTPPLPPPPPTPPQAQTRLSSSSSSEYLSSSSYGSLSSNGGIMGERKQTSQASSVLQRFKSN